METRNKIFATVRTRHHFNDGWRELPQKSLGFITWSLAVRWAKKKREEGSLVRLCESLGYNNQGHYIH